MKKNSLIRIGLVLVGVFSFPGLAMDYIAGKYTVDTAHTRVSFIVPHFVVSEVEGRFNDVTGDFELGRPFSSTRLNGKIAVKSIDTGVEKRDEHLRAKDFFEVDKYPEITLATKSITGTPQSFQMVALLTIKDVTKEVTFQGKVTGFAKDPWGGQRAALQATAQINRKDFHINYSDRIAIGPAVGEIVQIRFWTEGILKVEQK